MVEGTGLENRRRASVLEFESLLLRHIYHVFPEHGLYDFIRSANILFPDKFLVINLVNQAIAFIPNVNSLIRW